MKLHPIECTEVKYPVGLNMVSAINFAKQASLFIIGNVDKNKRINLICTGSSGAIIASLVYSQITGHFPTISICHIKKDGENSHSGDSIAYYSENVNIIIDDFSVTGCTLVNIMNKVERLYRDNLAVLSIDYLILSGISKRAVEYIRDTVQPLNVVTNQYSIDIFNKQLAGNGED